MLGLTNCHRWCSNNINCVCSNKNSVEVGVALDLQDVMEKVVLLHQAVQKERSQWSQSTSSDTLRKKLRQYASLLASQGALHTAYTYLAQDCDVCLFTCTHTHTHTHTRLHAEVGNPGISLPPPPRIFGSSFSVS